MAKTSEHYSHYVYSIATPKTIQCCCHNDGDPFVLQKEGRESGSIILRNEDVERILRKKTARIQVPVENNKDTGTTNTDQEITEEAHIYYCPRRDVIFLNCSDFVPLNMIRTILGIGEDNQCSRVEIVCYRAEESKQVHPRTRPGPHSKWKRASPVATAGGFCGHTGVKPKRHSTRIQWIDFRDLQREREAIRNESFLSTEAGVVHFLRSILTPSHDASPWATAAGTVLSTESTGSSSPDIVVLLLNRDPNNNEDNTFSLLKNFRVSDVAPSWFMHGFTFLEGFEESSPDLFRETANQTFSSEQRNSVLLIYKKLSHRPSFRATNPALPCLDQDADNRNIDIRKTHVEIAEETFGVVAKGCLWEEIQEEKEDGNDVDDNHHDPEKKIDDGEVIGLTRDTDTKNGRFRLVSPPYLDLDEEYPGANLFAKLFSKETLKIFTEDALSVPQWTPWPETAHYRVSSFGNDKPWTVFPLCHCFPATDPEKFTWVPATKAFVPRTCQLLEEILGCGDGKSYLRTALFSQLAPRSVLEEHTGWADLANHVLRLHIPLIVPNRSNPNSENDDLCGTWVDGCVETHAVGRPLVFDDSKIHRAFNYSDEDRIVLIVDLARPERLPLGTAKSGHTEELDAFIQQMNTPK